MLFCSMYSLSFSTASVVTLNSDMYEPPCHLWLKGLSAFFSWLTEMKRCRFHQNKLRFCRSQSSTPENFR
jgi:hypothetical protein